MIRFSIEVSVYRGNNSCRRKLICNFNRNVSAYVVNEFLKIRKISDLRKVLGVTKAFPKSSFACTEKLFLQLYYSIFGPI